ANFSGKRSLRERKEPCARFLLLSGRTKSSWREAFKVFKRSFISIGGIIVRIKSYNENEKGKEPLEVNTFLPADILMPRVDSMGKWAVVACDQYSSEPEYWEKVKEKVQNHPSALH